MAKKNTNVADANEVMATNPSISPIVKALENLFDKLNKKCFDGELERPVIVIQKDTTRGAFGWCSGGRTWKGNEHSDEVENKQFKEGFYEITICAEYLNRNHAEVIETLLHEMCHLYACLHGIKDTSNHGWHHNERYKKIAEEHGMVVEKDAKYGWCVTSLNEDMRLWVEKLNMDDFTLSLRKLSKAPRKVNKSHSIKYVCPCCDQTVRATKSVSIRCALCECDMVES